ncbi:BnaA06g20510D [Brassica napus]|uniref:BnaA06g20510D protein n=1 Tax=Brassica napus TaxID=3708 RepID=A0A078G9T8_BRANA|nr:BnaA06g20510D [Brassica napus]
MPSQSRTCRYVHGVDVTYRIREMEKVKPEPPRSSPPCSSPPFINTAPCWRRALVQPRDVRYNTGGVENVIRFIVYSRRTLVFLVIKSSDPFRVLNIGKGEGYSVKSRASLVLLLWKRDMGNVRRKQRKTWEYGIVTCNKDHYVSEYAFPPVSSRCFQRVVSTSIIVFSRVSIVNLIDYAFCKNSGLLKSIIGAVRMRSFGCRRAVLRCRALKNMS